MRFSQLQRSNFHGGRLIVCLEMGLLGFCGQFLFYFSCVFGSGSGFGGKFWVLFWISREGSAVSCHVDQKMTIKSVGLIGLEE